MVAQEKISETKRSFLERIQENQKFPKRKISISVNDKDLTEFDKLMAKHFPDIERSPAFNEMMLDALDELRELDTECKIYKEEKTK